MKNALGLGKYRDLLLAILLFIVLDLGILFFNFFASIQLERDASRIVRDHGQATSTEPDATTTEDDAYYAQFKVPDDLVW